MICRSRNWLTLAAAAAGVFLGTAGAAMAQSTVPAEGLYVTGGVGATFPRNADLDSAGVDLDADQDIGWAALIGIGHGYGNGFRTEFEIGYRRNAVDSISGTEASGDMAAWSFMANVLYDVPVAARVRPFLGAGLGVARVSANGISPVSSSRIDDTDTAFAWQAIAGLAYPVTDRTEATLSYRYFSVPDAGWRTDAGASVDSRYETHAIMAGFRYSFGVPASRPRAEPAAEPTPAPVPAPRAEPPPAPAPPPVARNYLVFFDWDKATLTEEARTIIRSATEASKKVAVTRIRTTGHADRSGPDRYNMGLSLRRAAAVKAELVRLGVPPQMIVVVGKGEREPLVPTADGVREPQNRRVEIVLE